VKFRAHAQTPQGARKAKALRGFRGGNFDPTSQFHCHIDKTIELRTVDGRQIGQNLK